jgi:hypothetical protein
MANLSVILIEAVAHGQSLMTNEFTAEAEGVVYLDFSALRSADVKQAVAAWL